MKETLAKFLNKVVEFGKKVYAFFKKNRTVTAIVGFVLVAVILTLVAVLALNEFIVSVCILLVLEAFMAACLHKAEIWKHGILLAAHLIVAYIIGRVALVIVCIIAYIAATFALQLISTKKESSPKA